MSAQPAARNRVEEAIDRLTEEFRGRFSSKTIRDLVARSFDSYRESRVTDFVPLLAYKSARAELGAVSRASTVARSVDALGR